MKIPALTIEEQHNIESGAWFSRLSPPLRDAILARAVIKRYADAAPLAHARRPGRGVVRRGARRGARLLASRCRASRSC